MTRSVVQCRGWGQLASLSLAPESPSVLRDDDHRLLGHAMASISTKIFTVAEHTPEDGEYRATRRFLINPDCLRPFKLSAGEVVAIVSTQNPDTAVSAQRSI